MVWKIVWQSLSTLLIKTSATCCMNKYLNRIGLSSIKNFSFMVLHRCIVSKNEECDATINCKLLF